MEDANIGCDFYYECHKCKELIPGHYETNYLDPVIMVPDAKPNTYVFECKQCNPDAGNLL